jgi:ankyrin repeat protein
MEHIMFCILCVKLASLKGNINIARMLLESGADIHAESNDKGTALDYAAGTFDIRLDVGFVVFGSG